MNKDKLKADSIEYFKTLAKTHRMLIDNMNNNCEVECYTLKNTCNEDLYFECEELCKLEMLQFLDDCHEGCRVNKIRLIFP